MRPHLLGTILLALAGCLLPLPALAADPPKYSIVDLGDLGGGATEPRAISRYEPVVVGGSSTTSGEQHAFLWVASKGIQDLESLIGTTGPVESIAEDVSCGAVSHCSVVGTRTVGGKKRGFLIIYDFRAGTIKHHEVLPLPGDTESEAMSFTGNFVVVNSSGGTNGERTYLEWWSNIQRGHSVPNIVPFLGSGKHLRGSKTTGLKAVGQAEVKSSQLHAFWYDRSGGASSAKIHDIDPLNPGNSQARFLNEHDQIVGSFEKPNGEPVAAMWELWTGRTALVDPFKVPISRANAINTWGHVVGEGIGAGANGAAYWTSDTGWRLLDALIPSGSGWRLNSAVGINEAGQITGQGYRQGTGNPRGYFLDISQKPSWYPCTSRTKVTPCP